MAMSPMEMMNKIRNKAKLDEVDYGNIIAIRLNKPGKLKVQLVALDPEFLFKSRIQHFIQIVPDNEDPNEKVMVVDCQGQNCPVCAAANALKQSGVTVEMLNAAYKPKYPYQKLRTFLTMPEHYIVCARILQDSAEEGNYLPKGAELGSTQFLQLTKSALNSLMEAYEDFIDDADEDADNLPPLFGVFEDGAKEVESLTISCRVSVQPYAYNFTFGKAVKVKLEDVDTEKLEKLAEGPLEPTEDYMQKALKRIKDIQNYFVGGNSGGGIDNIIDSSVYNDGDSVPPFDMGDDEMNLDEL